MSAINLNTPVSFTDLPPEDQVHICKFLDQYDLAQFSRTYSSGYQLATDFQVWNSIAKIMNCPIDNNLDSRTQVLNFIARIIKRAEAIKTCPLEITDILKNPTVDQINRIIDWGHAREGLIGGQLLLSVA